MLKLSCLIRKCNCSTSWYQTRKKVMIITLKWLNFNRQPYCALLPCLQSFVRDGRIFFLKADTFTAEFWNETSTKGRVAGKERLLYPAGLTVSLVPARCPWARLTKSTQNSWLIIHNELLHKTQLKIVASKFGSRLTHSCGSSTLVNFYWSFHLTCPSSICSIGNRVSWGWRWSWTTEVNMNAVRQHVSLRALCTVGCCLAHRHKCAKACGCAVGVKSVGTDEFLFVSFWMKVRDGPEWEKHF